MVGDEGDVLIKRFEVRGQADFFGPAGTRRGDQQPGRGTQGSQ
jgi:hypothetical protein